MTDCFSSGRADAENSSQTNLAIKGIIALKAMSEIAGRTSNADSVQKYADLASKYLEFWTEHAMNSEASPPHTTLAYDNPDSYGEHDTISVQVMY